LPILRGAKNLNGLPPNIYVNELAAPQEQTVQMSGFVLAFIGAFNRGPVEQFVHIQETPTHRLVDAAEIIFGRKTGTEAGNQLLDHLDRARVKDVVFVRVLGEGHTTASLALDDRQATPEATMAIYPKAGPGEYANIFTAEVQDGTNPNTFKLILWSDIGKTETYDNLSMDPDDERYFVTVVNEASAHFVVEDLQSTAASLTEKMPAVISKTQLTGGSNGAALTEDDYIGTFNPGTGLRTGLKLLEGLPSTIVTDTAYIDFSSQNADDALRIFGEKYNSMTYTGTGTAKTVAAAATYREMFDTDHAQMVFGRYRSVGGQWVSGACLSAIVHVIGEVEDSGLAVECNWISGAEQPVDFDMATELFANQIAAFELKPSAKGDGSMAWRMSNDYTLAQKDVEGNIISDNENRKVNKRRLNSWIEKALFTVAAPWQGKAMTPKMKQAAENRLRAFFDNLKSPQNPLESPKIMDYSMAFDERAQYFDQYVRYLKVKHFNTAEWVLLNFQGGTNVEVDA
jgi:hypothetical protein